MIRHFEKDLRMLIRLIKQTDWAEIGKIQNESYTEIAPESVAVLKSKNELSPKTCLVATDQKGKILGCCLAYPWQQNSIPALYFKTKELNYSSNLFIHDLMVLGSRKKEGIGSCLANEIITIARKAEFKSISLVAVQGAHKFWQKFGFQQNLAIKPSSAYGKQAVFMQLELKSSR